jgi:hypothetical protein
MGPLDHFAVADLAASKVIVHRYLERGLVKPALARLQRCLSADPADEEVLDLLARAFEKLGKTDKADYVQRVLEERRRATGDLDGPTSVYVDVRGLGTAPVCDEGPTSEYHPLGGTYVRASPGQEIG